MRLCDAPLRCAVAMCRCDVPLASQLPRRPPHCCPHLARVMDKLDLSRKMKRLTAWLDTQNQPDGLAGRRFHGVPFGDAYLTIDPEHQASYASANRNRVHLCGMEAGMSAGGIARLIDVFANHGVRRFFVWLSPGPDLDEARSLLDQVGFSRNQ